MKETHDQHVSQNAQKAFKYKVVMKSMFFFPSQYGKDAETLCLCSETLKWMLTMGKATNANFLSLSSRWVQDIWKFHIAAR